LSIYDRLEAVYVMKADHVTGTLKLALEALGWDRVNVIHKPRLLSDNGSSYISGDLVNGL
jgi:putative transposase